MPDSLDRIASLSPEKRELLLAWIRDKRPSSPDPGSLPALVPQPEARWEPFPLTPVQEAYWAGRSGLYDLGGGTNIYQEFEILGPYEPVMARLHHAVRRLIGHHDMLRAVLQPSAGAVLQRVLPEVPPYEIEVFDLRGLTEPAAKAEVEKMRIHLCTKMGDVESWPLFDLVAQRLDEERIHFHTRFEPFLMDGEGRGHVVYQMLRLFENPDLELPAIRCSYRDYALTWRKFEDSELCRRSRDYWLRRLPALPRAPELPLSAALDPERPVRFVRHKGALLETAAWQRLKQRIARAGLTPSVVIISAFAEVVARWSRNPSFTLCAIGSYRPAIHPDIHELVANFNTISLLEVDRSAATFAERARDLQKRIAADLEHPYFSGFEVLRELNRMRGVSSRATLPVLFNSVVEYNHPSYQREANERLASCDLGTIRYLDLSMYPPQALMLTSVGEAPDGWLWQRWQAAEGLFPEGLVEGMIEDYGRLLLRLADEDGPWNEPRPEPRIEATVSGEEHEAWVLGYQVDLRQVEAVLERSPEVRLARVQSDGVGGRGLVASLVPEPGRLPAVDELRAKAAAELPYYMVPTRFEMLDALPLQADDTVDRRAHAAAAESPAFSRLESELAEVWREVLGVRPERTNDDLFALGADSVAVVRLVRRVRERFDRELPLSAVFQNGTLRGMSRFIGDA